MLLQGSGKAMDRQTESDRLLDIELVKLIERQRELEVDTIVKLINRQNIKHKKNSVI